MALIAKANKVRKLISCMKISAIHPNGNNMMNIQCAPQQAFFNSTKLAFVVIPFPGFPGLPDPIRAIVRRMSSTPAWIIFTSPVFRFPYPKTLHVAKSKIAVIPCPWGPSHFTATSIAISGLNPFPSRGFFPYISSNISGSHACSAAILIESAIKSVCRRSVERFRAMRALDFICLPNRRLWYPISRPLHGVSFSRSLSAFFNISVWHKFLISSLNCLFYIIHVVTARIGSEGYVTMQSNEEQINAAA